MGKAAVTVNRAARRLRRLQFELFPATCLLCGAAGEAGRDLCSGCYAELPRNVMACARCALPLAGSAEHLLCGQCRRTPPAFDRSHAPLLYRPPVDHLIKNLKFDGRLVNARLLGGLLAESLGSGRLPEGVVTVPLHPSRLRERGFDQALEIARPLAARLGLVLLPQAVARVRATTPQTGLDAAGRRSNVRGAFVVGRAFPLRHVAILDDVVTTGSTVQELSRVLRAAGVKEIDVWACARTAP